MVKAASVRLRHVLPTTVLALAAALFLLRGEGDASSPGVPSTAATVAAPAPVPADGTPPPCALGDGTCAGPAAHAPPPRASREGAPPSAAAPSVPPGAPQLLEFEAAYCAACATMAPVVTSIVKSCAKASEVVRRVDVAEGDGEALAQHYRVDALPTFLAVDAEGHEVFRKVGVQKPAELASLVAEVSGEDCAAN